MKILYLSVGAGGSDKVLLNLLDGFKDSSIEVFVVVHKRSSLITEISARGISPLVLRYKPDVWPRSETLTDKIKLPWRVCKQLLINHFAVRRLADYARANRIDLIHTNTGVFHIGYQAARRCRIPHVWHLHEYQDRDMRLTPFPSRRDFVRKLQDPASYKIAITDDVFNHFQLKPKNACRIYNGVLPKHTAPLPVEKERYFLYVGTIAPHKGLSELIDAFIEFSRKDSFFELRIAGDIPRNRYFRSLMQKIRACGVEDRIQLLGYRRHVHPLMAKASALIVPSRSEAFGLITAEAMFNKCLVIGRNTAGTKEQFDNGVAVSGTEIGLRYDETADLVEHMLQVSANTVGHYDPMLENAWNTVNTLYSIDDYAARVREVYTHLLPSDS